MPRMSASSSRMNAMNRSPRVSSGPSKAVAATCTSIVSMKSCSFEPKWRMTSAGSTDASLAISRTEVRA